MPHVELRASLGAPLSSHKRNMRPGRDSRALKSTPLLRSSSMKRLATSLGAAALLLAPLAAQAQLITTTPLWEETNATNPTVFGATTSNERGIAYNLANNHVYVAQANTAAGQTGTIFILDGSTGAQIGALDMTGVVSGTTGQNRAINDVEVTATGAIVACNLAVASNTFRCYRWDTETSAPVQIVNYAVGTNRLGDKITVEGTTLYSVSAASGTAPNAQVTMFTFDTTVSTPVIPSSLVLGGLASATASNCDV